MASSDLRKELTCSICLSLYTDPVFLRCGHNFCRSCIDQVLDTQDGSGGYSCPDCRAEYPERPAPERNMKLGNIVEHFLSTQSDMEETRIFCTYCIKSPVPAVKSCLQCEMSLCDDHLTAHNKTMDHILTKPTDSFSNKKCPIHKKVLEYYCLEDAAYLCVSCCLVGEHRGHQVELLDEASEKKKKILRKYLDELNPQKAEIQTRVQNLREHKRKIKEKASDKRKSVRKIFMEIKKQLEIDEKKVLREIYRQEEEIVFRISDLIRKMEIEEEELSRRVRHLEEMCHVTDPIRLLQESDITICGHGDGEDTGGNGEDTGGDGGKIKSEDDLDEVLISLTIHRSMRDIITNVRSQLGFQVPDILLDENTANSNIRLSEDLKTATNSEEEQDRTESPERFLTHPQVLSRCGFSSGRHYWEVKSTQTKKCGIAMSYSSIRKRGRPSWILSNNKTWCLLMHEGISMALHNTVKVPFYLKSPYPTIGVFLDYEAGRLSFYELCDPIRHLHTFTASFTEPLHAALFLQDEASLTIRS